MSGTDTSRFGASGGSRVLACALVLLVLVMNAGALRGTEALTPHSDNAMGAYPLRVEAARQWKAGRVPLWNPYKRAGSPLLADVLTGALYPGNLPFLLAGDGPRYRALDAVAIVHFVLAALFMYGFLRAIDVAPLAAVLGGLVYCANGAMLWLTSSWIQHACTMAWLPAILLAIQRLTYGRFASWTAIGGLAVGLQLLAGFPEFAFYSAVIALAYAATVRGGGGSRWRPLAGALTMYAIGAGLAAAQMIPAAELTLLSRRGAHVSLQEFLSLAASPAMVLGWIVPGIPAPLIAKTPLGGVCYLGAVAVALAVEGLRRVDRRSAFFASVLLLGFLLAIGPSSPLAGLAYRVPGFSMFRYPYKHVFEIMAAVSVLAALGADALLRGRSYSTATVTIATAAVVAVSVWITVGSSADAAASSTKLTIVGCLLFLAALATRRRAAAVIVAIVALVLSYAANRSEVLRSMAVDAGEARTAAADLARSLQGEVPWRYVLMTSIAPLSIRTTFRQEYLAADYPTELGVPALHGCCPFLWTPLAAALGMSDEGTFIAPRRTLGTAGQVLDVLACRWVGGERSAFGDWVSLRTVSTSGEFTLAERPNALPPVRFVDEGRCVDPAAAVDLLRSGGIDARTVALLECADRPPLPSASVAVKTASLVVDEPGHRVVRTAVEGTTPAVLVVSQSAFPGWHARVDGGATPIYRAYGLVQAIVVSAGAHEVVLDYHPASFRYGVIISCATALLIVIGVARRRRDQGHPELGHAVDAQDS